MQVSGLQFKVSKIALKLFSVVVLLVSKPTNNNFRDKKVNKQHVKDPSNIHEKEVTKKFNLSGLYCTSNFEPLMLK